MGNYFSIKDQQNTFNHFVSNGHFSLTPNCWAGGSVNNRLRVPQSSADISDGFNDPQACTQSRHYPQLVLFAWLIFFFLLFFNLTFFFFSEFQNFKMELALAKYRLTFNNLVDFYFYEKNMILFHHLISQMTEQQINQ